MAVGMNRFEFQRALKLSTPTFFAYFPLGIVFGVIAVHMNFPWYIALLMSAFIYGGSVQFVALGMMAQHNAISAILLATLFITLRNSFYGLSFIDRYKAPWYLKAFLMFTMVDATYATLLTHDAAESQNDLDFCFYLNLLFYLYWVVGTILGVIGGQWLPDFSGLAFILPCFFAVLVVENYLGHRSWIPLIIPMLASAITYYFIPQDYLLPAIITCVAFIIFYHKPKGHYKPR